MFPVILLCAARECLTAVLEKILPCLPSFPLTIDRALSASAFSGKLLKMLHLSTDFSSPSSSSHASARVMQIAKESKFPASTEQRALAILAKCFFPKFPQRLCDQRSNNVSGISLGSFVGVTCDERAYSAGLNARSCLSAPRQSPTSEVQETWAYHSQGFRPDVQLPVKLFSGEHFLDRGRCLGHEMNE